MNATQTELPRVTLYYREGSSDKVYQCAIEPQGDRFIVTFAYGRRGSTLNTGTKTNAPVDYDAARCIYDRLVQEKTAKGYTEGENGTPYTSPDRRQETTGLLPQLLNPIDEPLVDILLHDPKWCLQEKFDGRRLLIRKHGAALHGINRKGCQVGLPEPVFQVIQQYGADVILDGESLGDVFQAFDILELDGVNLRSWPYRQRLAALLNLLAGIQQRVIRYTDTAFTTAEKQRAFKALKSTRKEGVVFKLLNAPYTPGRPNSGGTQLKHKFCSTLSAVVARLNDRRSVELRLLNGQGWVPCGNVTIPPNHPIPVVGQVVEIRYLYTSESRILYQPVYLGPRTDVEQHECVCSQLKFKAEEDAC